MPVPRKKWLRKLRKRVTRASSLSSHSRDSGRNETWDRVLPADLTGKSLLDVGCAEGDFCFEAERRGAADIVGCEIKRSRWEIAIHERDNRGSGARFYLGPIEDHLELLRQDFDIVLALNVLHHLQNPIDTIHRLASVARQVLILEYATPLDGKFLKHIDWSPDEVAAFVDAPIIGVSSLRECDQTFLFTDNALATLIADHGGREVRMEFSESPIKDRRIVMVHSPQSE